MLRRLGLALTALATTVAVAAPTGAQADPIVVPDLIDDELLSCTELVPHALSVTAEPVRLDVRILLDGATRAEAETAVGAMKRAYTPLKISVAASFQPVSFTGSDAAGINQQAKDLFGGTRPDGIDVVYTMTTKDLTAEGSPLGNNVAGLADCIGGVRYDNRAFATGEVIADGPGSLLGLPLPFPTTDATGKTMAHEIGHLLGAHHHYSSPEGLLTPGGPNVLSLMGPALGVISLKFSTLNTLMVQGHTQLYAND